MQSGHSWVQTVQYRSHLKFRSKKNDSTLQVLNQLFLETCSNRYLALETLFWPVWAQLCLLCNDNRDIRKTRSITLARVVNVMSDNSWNNTGDNYNWHKLTVSISFLPDSAYPWIYWWRFITCSHFLGKSYNALVQKFKLCVKIPRKIFQVLDWSPTPHHLSQ